MTTEQYTYDFNQEGVRCRHSEENGWEPLEPNCLNCGYKTDECGCGNYEEGWYAKEEAKEEKKAYSISTKNTYDALCECAECEKCPSHINPYVWAETNHGEEKRERGGEFSTKNLFPAEFAYADPRYFTPKYQVCCDNLTEGKHNKEKYMGGCVLKKGKKITAAALENKKRTNPELFANFVSTTILTMSQTTAYQSNQDNYEDITSRLDRQMLRYNFKDRIPKGKHIFAVIVPTRSNPSFKNCPNYDIPYKVPVMMRDTDAGAIWMPNGRAYAMNPVGDAIIVLKD